MDVAHLEYFKVLAEVQHLTKSAALLNITQPALSLALSKLEKKVGVPLFDRTGRGIVLNKYGQAYYNHLIKALNSLHNAQRDVDDLIGQADHVTTIALTNFNASHEVTLRFCALHPDFRIIQYVSFPDKLIEDLKQMRADFIFSTIYFSDPEIESILLSKDDLVLVVNKKHPLASRKSVRLEEVKDDTFLCMSKGYAHRMYQDRMCELAGFKPKNIIEYFPFQVFPLVASGAGVSIVVNYPFQKPISDNYIYLELEHPKMERPFYLLWLKNRHKTKIMRSFIDFVKNYFECPALAAPPKTEVNALALTAKPG